MVYKMGFGTGWHMPQLGRREPKLQLPESVVKLGNDWQMGAANIRLSKHQDSALTITTVPGLLLRNIPTSDVLFPKGHTCLCIDEFARAFTP